MPIHSFELKDIEVRASRGYNVIIFTIVIC